MVGYDVDPEDAVFKTTVVPFTDPYSFVAYHCVARMARAFPQYQYPRHDGKPAPERSARTCAAEYIMAAATQLLRVRNPLPPLVAASLPANLFAVMTHISNAASSVTYSGKTGIMDAVPDTETDPDCQQTHPILL